jgi:hypothetical protein
MSFAVASHLASHVGFLEQSVEYARLMEEMTRPRQPPS